MACQRARGLLPRTRPAPAWLSLALAITDLPRAHAIIAPCQATNTQPRPADRPCTTTTEVPSPACLRQWTPLHKNANHPATCSYARTCKAIVSLSHTAHLMPCARQPLLAWYARLLPSSHTNISQPQRTKTQRPGTPMPCPGHRPIFSRTRSAYTPTPRPLKRKPSRDRATVDTSPARHDPTHTSTMFTMHQTSA